MKQSLGSAGSEQERGWGPPGGGGAITAYGGVWGDPDVKAPGVSDTRETAPVWVLSRPGVGKEARRRFLQDSGGG